jgi:uncharacterized protein (TIGR02284 family)
MPTTARDRQTVDRLQGLLNETFEARDALYAAADRLSDSDGKTICRWLADRLGAHAATLQQLIAATGAYPAEPRAGRLLEQEIETVRAEAGDDGVLNLAEDTEHKLVTQYDAAIKRLRDREVRNLLSRQRSESEFADCVLRKLTQAV